MKHIMQEYGDNWLYHYHDIIMKEDKLSQKKQSQKKPSTCILRSELITAKKSSGKEADDSHCNEGGDHAKILIPLSGSIDVADLKNIPPDQIVNGEVIHCSNQLEKFPSCEQ